MKKNIELIYNTTNNWNQKVSSNNNNWLMINTTNNAQTQPPSNDKKQQWIDNQYNQQRSTNDFGTFFFNGLSKNHLCFYLTSSYYKNQF
jgi:hypothetical protein